ncbi:serine O-acetyltransferase EpsC [Paenirhodobacter populi]|uniref:Serine acetyltransferase n=1 Tax=Paenirhodobacter populi TaxID=2306993 RepID=A0A443JN15_9RHOB|nr:serine O-acetyltransferase EpsC [Sinirhodobacter populi]RWR21915.1 serine acetyltransferase [Sinirhodobacter populi]
MTADLSPPRDDFPDIDAVVRELAAARHDWRSAHHRLNEPGPRELPSRERVAEIVEALRGVLYPMRLGPADLRQEHENRYVALTLDTALGVLLEQVRLELAWEARHIAAEGAAPLPRGAEAIVTDFANGLSDIRRLLDTDVLAAFNADPAARSVDEVLLCYPGIQALIHYRIAHRLHLLGVPLIARMVSELAHGATGIDIHPGATIGERFFIDHGTGIVIGATAIIGDRVQIYQAVTLGAKSFPTDAEGRAIKGAPRHPIVEDDVVIYSGATVLGRVTIGQGAILGGSVWVTEDVAPHTIVSQARMRSVGQPEERRTA